MRDLKSNPILKSMTLAAALACVTAVSSPAIAGDYGATKTTSAKAGKDIVDTAVAAGNFKTLVAAVKAAGLVDVLKGEGPFTVFAPTDEAFAKLPKGTLESLLKPENRGKLSSILTYHVVSGRVPAEAAMKLSFAATVNGQRASLKVTNGKLLVAGATVVGTDVAASNGVIHVIDTVMMPADKNIVQTAVAAGSFKTLVAAVGAAGLADVLASEGPFTVFAPTDDAFAALPAGTVESLLKTENRSKLVDILKYHVVAGRVYADQALSKGDAATLQEGKIAITAKSGVAYVNKATIVKTDIENTNGVIHVIDKVLMPSEAMSSTSEKAKTQAASR